MNNISADIHRAKDLEKIADFYGIESQKLIAVEEMAELTQAVSKLNRAVTVGEMEAAWDNFLEEIADVQIMIWQLRLFVDDKEVLERVNQKIDRQLAKIEERKAICGEDYVDDEYAEVENLQVILANDIEFDKATNTEWVPIGTKERYFTGTFDGGNFSIRNWVTSRPLFFSVDTKGTVKNLTVDASCTLTANYAAEDNYFGAITRYNQGQISECHNHADIDVTGSWRQSTYVAGLAGYVYAGAKIENCSMTGDITADGTFNVIGDVYFAGITGRLGSGGVAFNCDFTGNLTFAGSATKYAYVGGIVGQTYGDVSECSTVQGKTINGGHESNTAQYIYWGGIAGSAANGKVKDCENNASVELKYQ